LLKPRNTFGVGVGGFLFGIAPNVQYALESADEVIREAREKIAGKLANEGKTVLPR
jgi:hypothetical protein